MSPALAGLGAATAIALLGCGIASAPAREQADREVLLRAGERAFQKCYACHDLDPKRNDLTGPTLHHIVGRRIAAEPGYDYSPALRQFAAGHPTWTPQLLARFIADPETLVPGTSMTFHGISDENERSALIAYLEDSTAAR